MDSEAHRGSSSFPWLLLLGQLAVDVLAVLLAFVLGHLTYHVLGFQRDLRSLRFYLGVALAATAVVVAVFERLGLYRPQVSVLNVQEYRSVIRGVLVSALGFLALSFYYRDPEGNELSRAIITLAFVWLMVLANLFRMIVHKLCEELHSRGIGCRRVLLYGAGSTGRQLLRRLTACPQLGFLPVGFVDDRADRVGRSTLGQTGKEHTRAAVLGTGENLEAVIRQHSVEEVFLAVPGAGSSRVRRVFETCRRLGVRCRFVPRLHGLFYQEVSIETLDGIPLVAQLELFRRPIYDGLKRLFDIVFSAAVLLVLAPVLGVLAILVRWDSPGPALFVHDRVGLDGRVFRMYKFRTMGVETPVYEFHPKSGEDPRLTRVGRILRRLSLDELPQFLNVLLGDMSVVGPRPEMPFIVERYTDQQRMRLRVKPGLTGLWQISADRSRMIHENMDYDLFYLFNRGPLLDMLIIVETVFSVVRGIGAR